MIKPMSRNGIAGLALVVCALALAAAGVRAEEGAKPPAPVRLRPVLRGGATPPPAAEPKKPADGAASSSGAGDSGRYVSVFDLETESRPGEEIDLEITGELRGAPASELSFEVGESPASDPAPAPAPPLSPAPTDDDGGATEDISLEPGTPENAAADATGDVAAEESGIPGDDSGEYADAPTGGVLDEAEALRADGRPDDARALLLAFEREHPDDPMTPEAALAAARIAAESETGLDTAMEELQRLVVRHPDTRAAHKALLDIGEFAQIAGDHEQALRAFGAIRLVETSPGLARQNSIQIAQALMSLGRYGQAILEYDSLLRDHPKLELRSDIMMNLADALMATGEYERGGKIFEESARRFSEPHVRARALLHQGLCLEMLGRTDRARAVYDGVIAAWPDGPERGPAEKRLADLDQPLLP